MSTQGKDPLIIAHRGASGYLPEHSLAAKALAYGLGADYLEQDIIASRDGVLLILHDLWLDDVSDVATRFPGRSRDDGRHYCIDFDVDEIRTLHFGERVDPATGVEKFPRRFTRAAGSFRVVTLEEEIRFIQGLNASTGRNVGIYPEIKAPQWHADQGVDLAALVIDTLAANGYLEPDSLVYLQCFDAETLRKVRQSTGPVLPIIQLLSSKTTVDATLLRAIAEYANGIGPSIKLILRGLRPDGHYELSDLVSIAQSLDLEIHPYTFRVDDLPDGCSDFSALLRLFITDLEVDGLFTDFTDLVASFMSDPAK
ncbi:MAG: glycerophosphodiester phosphodiesterase [Gammaproteobacteria bacterium]|nr:glycerophosphodiester phosphodiesterase [Gammaproteobacteria bacterium]MDP6675037.1 glycerophosphodiester phosphodiesterase [Gammaproteobacteria bacterium]